jgi:putative membrane protein
MSDPRVFFAAERTLLAWIRTGLTIMGFGFVVARFGLFLDLLDARRMPSTAAAASASHFSSGIGWRSYCSAPYP